MYLGRPKCANQKAIIPHWGTCVGALRSLFAGKTGKRDKDGTACLRPRFAPNQPRRVLLYVKFRSMRKCERGDSDLQQVQSSAFHHSTPTSGGHPNAALREHEFAQSSIELEHVRPRPEADHHHLHASAHTHRRKRHTTRGTTSFK